MCFDSVPVLCDSRIIYLFYLFRRLCCINATKLLSLFPVVKGKLNSYLKLLKKNQHIYYENACKCVMTYIRMNKSDNVLGELDLTRSVNVLEAVRHNMKMCVKTKYVNVNVLGPVYTWYKKCLFMYYDLIVLYYFRTSNASDA